MHVAVQVKPVHFVVQPLDFGDFLVRDALAGKPSGEALKATHHVEQFAEVLFA